MAEQEQLSALHCELCSQLQGVKGKSIYNVRCGHDADIALLLHQTGTNLLYVLLIFWRQRV